MLLVSLVASPLVPAAAPAQGVREDFALGSSSARRLSLEEAVAVGLEENPEVRSARFRFDATRAGLWEAYGNFLPQLNLFALLQRSSSGPTLIDGIPFESPRIFTSAYQFDLTHRLLDAGRDLFRLGGARAERSAADAQLATDRLRIAGTIKRAYIAALAAGALRDQARREIERRSVRLQLATARFELGAVTRSDVLQGRIGVSQAEVALVENERGIRTAKLDLMRAMGVEADADSIELVDRFEIFEPGFDADSLVRVALREHPNLRRLRALEEARESEHRIAKSYYLPNLEAGASFSSSVSDTSEFLFRDLEQRSAYRLSLNWELFGGFSRYNQTSRSKAELRAAEEALRAAELEVETGVRSAHLTLLTTYQTHQTNAESVELAQQELELAQQRYRIGALSFPDLLDSQLTFSGAETTYIRSAYDFFIALADLEEASSQSLFPPGSPAAASP